MPIVLDGTQGISTPMYAGSITSNPVTPSVNMKNRIINGACVIDQRNAGASVNPTSGSFVYTVDRWAALQTQSSKLTVQQNAGSVTPPSGFTNYLGITSSSAYSIVASDQFLIVQYIEGFNVADLAWGTASAATVTLSFWVRSSLTGTFGGALQNANSTRAYPFTYTISSANTWEYKTVTIAGDTTGTWNTGNTTGITLFLGLGVGSDRTGTAGAWAGSNFRSATGAVSVVGTNGATFYITGVDLRVGSYTVVPQDFRSYGTELALCQRYYYKVSGAVGERFGVGMCTATTTADILVPFMTTMRTNPTALEQSGTAGDYSVALGTSQLICSSVPTFSNATTSASMVKLTVASGLTANNVGMARAVNSNAYLAWSAEL